MGTKKRVPVNSVARPSTRSRLGARYSGLKLTNGTYTPEEATGGPRRGNQIKAKEFRTGIATKKYDNHQIHEQELYKNMGRAPPPWIANLNFDISRKPTPRVLNFNGQWEYNMNLEPRGNHTMMGYKTHISDYNQQHPLTYTPYHDVHKGYMQKRSVQGFAGKENNDKGV